MSNKYPQTERGAAIDPEKFLLGSLPLFFCHSLSRSLFLSPCSPGPFLPRKPASQKSGLLSHYEGGTVLKAVPRRHGSRRIKARVYIDTRADTGEQPTSEKVGVAAGARRYIRELLMRNALLVAISR